MEATFLHIIGISPPIQSLPVLVNNIFFSFFVRWTVRWSLRCLNQSARVSARSHEERFLLAAQRSRIPRKYIEARTDLPLGSRDAENASAGTAWCFGESEAPPPRSAPCQSRFPSSCRLAAGAFFLFSSFARRPFGSALHRGPAVASSHIVKPTRPRARVC